MEFNIDNPGASATQPGVETPPSPNAIGVQFKKAAELLRNLKFVAASSATYQYRT